MEGNGVERPAGKGKEDGLRLFGWGKFGLSGGYHCTEWGKSYGRKIDNLGQKGKFRRSGIQKVMTF